ncbi:MAG TPA: hypothetical protein VFI31_16645, partial [Pirellulales bacterium]|nr:hypothetical protein [Pirellulales bacterium]
CAITGRNGIGGWGKAGRIRPNTRQTPCRPAMPRWSRYPGHRRGNDFLENHFRVAALPQPPLPLDLLDVR